MINLDKLIADTRFAALEYRGKRGISSLLHQCADALEASKETQDETFLYPEDAWNRGESLQYFSAISNCPEWSDYNRDIAPIAQPQRLLWRIKPGTKAKPKPPEVPDGYALVSIEQLEIWKRLANTVAALSLKDERKMVCVRLKQEIADVIADPQNLTEETNG